MSRTVNITVGTLLVLFVCLELNAGSICGQTSRKKPKVTDYDYKALAIQSIREVVHEANELPNIGDKADLLITAAGLLSESQKSEAAEVLDQALTDLRAWESAADAPLSRGFEASDLRHRILAQYLLVDKEKAAQLTSDEKFISSQSEAKPLKSNATWKKTLLDRQVAADRLVLIAESLMESDPQQATSFLASSVRDGIVSLKLVGAIQKLHANSELLMSVHKAIANDLHGNVALDSTSIRSASILSMDQDMGASSRLGFVQFLLRSLDSWNTLLSNSRREGSLDSSYIDSMFMAFAFNARPVFLQYAADDTGRFDLLLDQVSLQASAKTRDLLKSTAVPEPTNPKDRLTDILREPQASKRDTRLLRLVISLLRREDAEDYDSLFAEAIRNVSDEALKSSLGYFVALSRVERFAKAQRWNDAVKAAEAVSSNELRAWAFFALSSSVAANDRYLAMTLVNSALNSLEGAAPTPRRVEVALFGAALTSVQEPSRAAEILGSVAKYANAIVDSPDSSTNIARAVVFEISIGGIKILPAKPPTRLSDVQVNSAIGSLAKRDWFGLQNVASGIKNPQFRLALKLELARGAIQDSHGTTSASVSKF